jgi:hypothetical protein
MAKRHDQEPLFITALEWERADQMEDQVDIHFNRIRSDLHQRRAEIWAVARLLLSRLSSSEKHHIHFLPLCREIGEDPSADKITQALDLLLRKKMIGFDDQTGYYRLHSPATQRTR